MNTQIVNLEFNNADATPNSCSITCSEDSVKLILTWYGSYYAGDDYEVTLNGELLNLGINGELIES